MRSAEDRTMRSAEDPIMSTGRITSRLATIVDYHLKVDHNLGEISDSP
jgi:hypothetical protein